MSSPKRAAFGRRSDIMSPVIFGAFVLCAFFLTFLQGRDLFGGVDGAYFLVMIQSQLTWSWPGIGVALSPWAGVTSVQFPMNAWLNPVYVVFVLGNSPVTIALSYTIAVVFYWAGTVTILRVLGVSWRLAILAGLAPCIIIFPPLMRVFGLTTGLQANPGYAFEIASFMFALSLLISVGRSASFRQWLMRTAALGAVIIYGLLCDPFWMVILLVSAVPFGLAAMFSGGGIRGIWLRGCALAVVAVVLVLSGFAHYVLGLAEMTARQYFTEEIWTRFRRFPWGGFTTASVKSFQLSWFVLTGLLLALVFGRRLVKLFAATSLVHIALILLMTILYVGHAGDWNWSRPTYIERLGMPFYIGVGALGWLLALRSVVLRLRGASHWSGALIGLRANLAAALITAVGYALISSWLKPPLPADPALLVGETIRQELTERTRLLPGDVFRGRVILGGAIWEPEYLDERVAVLVRYSGSEAELTQYSYGVPGGVVLWERAIPTILEYGQMISPELYFLTSRLWALPTTLSRQNTVHLQFQDAVSLDLLAALGGRYVVSYQRPEPTGEVTGALLNELRHANLGQYSPTEVIVSNSANAYPELMREPEFDFERQIILTEQLENDLVPATFGKLVYERGGIRVRGSSAGTSLLLLPIQYSHCLVMDRGEGKRLLRANLLQAAVLFSGELDTVLSFPFGPLINSGCRLDDYYELRNELGLRSDGTHPVPAVTDVAPWSAYPFEQIFRGRVTQLFEGL